MGDRDSSKINILKEAVALGEALADLHIKWAFVGGIAVAIHGHIRATEDIDIIICADDLNKLDIHLKKLGYIINKESIDFSDGFKLFRRVKIIDEEYFVLDILIPPDDRTGILENRIEGHIEDTEIYVISKEDLIKMKKSSGRTKDLSDVEELEK